MSSLCCCFECDMNFEVHLIGLSDLCPDCLDKKLLKPNPQGLDKAIKIIEELAEDILESISGISSTRRGL